MIKASEGGRPAILEAYMKQGEDYENELEEAKGLNFVQYAQRGD